MPDQPSPPAPPPPGWAPEAADEGRHDPGSEPWWNESWYLDFCDPERGIGGYVRLGLYPNQGTAWYWACVVGPDRPLVTVIDHEVAIPPRSLEIRTEGLWAHYTVETPFDHVTVGVEAFAVALDDAAEAYGPMHGERVPLGFDLEWETDGGRYAYPVTTRYEVPCRVHGEVLLGSERFEIDGIGQRDHSWGVRDWWTFSWSWTAGALDDGTRFHGLAADVDGVPLYGTGYVQAPSGHLVEASDASHDTVTGAHGLPTGGTWRVGDLELDVEPVAFAPVLLEDDSGRVSRFPRAWCRFRDRSDPAGRAGHGWTEWNQIQPAAGSGG